MMKALVLNKPGGVENLILEEIEKPAINENEVLVEVKAISINPVDVKIRKDGGWLKHMYGRSNSIILGWDIAGIITEVGEKVTKFIAGDKVFGMVNFVGSGNAYAEFVAAPECHLAKMPANISFEEAAATTLAALTALQALKGTVKEGDRVLIHAGSGGVGHYAIQMAKSLGAYVYTTCSLKNRDFVLSLGADEHIDYQQVAFEKELPKLDFILDAIGGETLMNSTKIIKDGGTIITIEASSPEVKKAREAVEKISQAVELFFLLVASNGEDMDVLGTQLESGALKAHVSKTFPFSEMGKAHQAVETGRTVGKVVVQV